MKRFLIGFFLSFCFLLLNGFSQLSAQQCGDRAMITPFQLTHHDAVNTYGMVIKSSSRRSNHHNVLWFERDEKEDDEFTSSNSSYTLINFFNQTAQYTFSCTRKVLSFYTYFPCTSSYRYVVLQVFRI